mgnify:CR=1 FL=1
MVTLNGFGYIRPVPPLETNAAMYSARKESRPAFAIFTETICEGLIPAWHDERGYPVTYLSEKEAQREIAEMLVGQLQDFLDGNREFEDAIVTSDFILPVDLWPDGCISTEDGRSFKPIEP